MSRISFEVSQVQHKSIKALALIEGVPIRTLVWGLCEEKLRQHQKEKKHQSYGAGHDDCPICAALGPSRRYNAKTERALISKSTKTQKRFKNIEGAIADLRS